MIRDANMNQVEIWEANLKGADLGHANLKDANLISTKLVNTNLDSTNFENAILAYANIEDAYKYTIEQLMQSCYMKEATMPDGLKFEAWVAERRIDEALLAQQYERLQLHNKKGYELTAKMLHIDAEEFQAQAETVMAQIDANNQ